MGNELACLINSFMNSNNLNMPLIDDRAIKEPNEFVNYLESLSPTLNDYVNLRDLFIERALQVEQWGKYTEQARLWRDAQSIRNIGVYFDDVVKRLTKK